MNKSNLNELINQAEDFRLTEDDVDLLNVRLEQFEEKCSNEYREIKLDLVYNL